MDGKRFLLLFVDCFSQASDCELSSIVNAVPDAAFFCRYVVSRKLLQAVFGPARSSMEVS